MRKVIFILSVCFISNYVIATENDSLINSGNSKYNEGQYFEAIENYLAVVSNGVESAELYYNLGNSYFKLSDLPSAILYFEKAKKIAPNDDDIDFNLRVANNRIVDKIETVPLIFFKKWWNSFYNMYSANYWAKITIFSVIITLIIITIYLFSRTRNIKKGFFIVGILFILITITAFTLSSQKYKYSKEHNEAIVFEPTITIKSSPNRNSVDLFVIHEGTKIQIIDRVEDWCEVKIANGSIGWMPSSTIKQI